MSQLDPKWQMSYTASASDDVVVKNKPGFLHAIIIGEWVSAGTIQVSDHATTGDANVKIYLKSGTTDASGFPKTVPVNAEFKVGITADIGASQTKVTFIFR